jgi:hypothetical protein
MGVIMPESDKIEFISQPLLTSEGFVNEACLNELGKAINNMPPIYERCVDDKEWSTKRWTFVSNITGSFAKYAVRQSPYGCPSGIENVVCYLDACLKKQVPWNGCGMAELSLCDIGKLLYDILYEKGVSIFDFWNVAKNGNKNDILFVDRYSRTDPDNDFIDLDALLRNVCLDIRMERRQNDQFDKEFNEKYNKSEESGI